MARSFITQIVLKGTADPSVTKACNKVDSALSKVQKNFAVIGKAAKVAAGLTATGLVASAKSAIDYESAFAGVMKTVEETATTTYEDLSNSIRNMAKTMPASVEEIASVAEAAGQLGIKADDITKFTETMINLGETTNLTSDEAATSIAKLFNVTGTSMEQVANFGATLVALGNNAATTEADVLNMATRIASSGKQIGLTEQQTLALATSLSSVGLEAEGGGTAISTVMTKIDKAVALNSDTLATWAETAGLSTKEFKTLWENDAYGALQKVVGGMGDVTKGGENLNILLEELGIKGIRESDTMKRLSSASAMMADMTSLANKAWSENTALTNEANTRYATLASKMAVMKNKVNDIAITVGEALMPHIEKALDKISELDFDAIAQSIVDKIQWVVDNFDKITMVVGTIGGIFAAVKIGTFISDIVTLVSNVKKLATAIELGTKIKAVFGGVGKVFTFLGSIVKGVIALISAHPIVAAIVAVIAIITLLWTKCEGFRNFFINMWENIKVKVSEAKTWIADKLAELPSKMLSIGSDIVSGLWEGIQGAKNWLSEKISSFVDGITKVFTLDFKINSPSKLMSNEVGKYLPQGIGVGIEQNADAVYKPIQELSSKAVALTQKTIPTSIGNPKPISSGSSNNSYNIVFSPTINGGNAEENRKMLREEEEEFERRIDEYFAKKGRLAF